MSKRLKKLDNSQLTFDFESKIETYQQARQEILDACQDPQPAKNIDNADEACIEIAAAIKRAIRQTNMSRPEVVDAINEYFSWPTTKQAYQCTGGIKEKHLSIHMFNHYLSKPTEYPIPSFYIYAIQSITGSLEITGALAEAMDARVITGAEVRQMALGKLDETILEMQRLKKELRGRRANG